MHVEEGARHKTSALAFIKPVGVDNYWLLIQAWYKKMTLKKLF